MIRKEVDNSLKGTKWLWLYSGENLPDRLKPALKALRSMKLKVARTWTILRPRSISSAEAWIYTHAKPGSG